MQIVLEKDQMRKTQLLVKQEYEYSIFTFSSLLLFKTIFNVFIFFHTYKLSLIISAVPFFLLFCLQK